MVRRATRVIAVITFDRVTKTYATSTRPALDKVSAEIGKGEFVFLIGPSGSGKSTFLRLMVREEKPDSGTLTINGADVAKLSNRQVPKHRQKIGYVFQDFNLLPSLTAAENVAFPRELDGVPVRQARAEAMEALASVGIAELAQRRPHEMSGGQAQRLQLARALARRARVLVLDECTSALDGANQAAVMETLRAAKAGRTTLVVTHKLPMMRMCDRILVLHGGAVAEQGTYEELMERRGVFAQLARGGEWMSE